MGGTLRSQPFRQLTDEVIRLIWARLKLKLGDGRLRDVWQLYFQSAAHVSSWHFLDLCNDLPLGVSRAELHQCLSRLCASSPDLSAAGGAGASTGGQTLWLEALEAELRNADKDALQLLPTWGNPMQGTQICACKKTRNFGIGLPVRWLGMGEMCYFQRRWCGRSWQYLRYRK